MVVADVPSATGDKMLGQAEELLPAFLRRVDTSSRAVQVLIVCHVRRLYPVKRELQRARCQLHSLRTSVVYAGMPMVKNRDMLRSSCPHIVLGTPGRIRSLIRQGDLQLGDSAQLLLDDPLGCLEQSDLTDLKSLISQARKRKQEVDSATPSAEEAPKRCRSSLEEERVHALSGLAHHCVRVAARDRDMKMCQFLDALDFDQVVIFVNSTATASRLEKKLVEEKERSLRYECFRNFEKRILVTSDDQRKAEAERVNLVFGYDVPESSEMYLHRAAHIDHSRVRGNVVTFASSEEEASFEEVRRELHIELAEPFGMDCTASA
mmetsp:Transcript_54218/g.108850  ORF Transcript_54218/g.108850 Transcript_54218/m.108850 type:complete len:321 (-) Transcript_54218:180-1142(-)